VPLYRSKPTTVDAEQWFPDKPCRGVVMYQPGNVTLYSRVPGTPSQVFPQDPYPAVQTIQGEWVRVSPGDWIIREPDGEHFYPCKDEVFRARYELVE
jgi:hypothetical protein